MISKRKDKENNYGVESSIEADYRSLIEADYRIPGSKRYPRNFAQLMWFLAALIFLAKIPGKFFVVTNGHVTIGRAEITSFQFWLALTYIPLGVLVFRGNKRAIILAASLWTIDRGTRFFLTGEYGEFVWLAVVLIPAYMALVAVFQAKNGKEFDTIS